MNRGRGLGLIGPAVLALVVAIDLLVRRAGSPPGLLVAAGVPMIALLTAIYRKLWQRRARDPDAAVAADIAELQLRIDEATARAYPHEKMIEAATSVAETVRATAERTGKQISPDEAPGIAKGLMKIGMTFAASQAMTDPDVLRARQVLAADLLRQHAADQPFDFYTTPLRGLLWLVADRPFATMLSLLAGLAVGGGLGFGLAEMYFGGNIVLKIIATIIAAAVTMIWFGAMRLFGLCELRGWAMLCCFLGAVAMISVYAVGAEHWPWWGGLLVGSLYVTAGLVGQPPTVYGSAATADPAGPPPTLSSVSMFPHLR